MDFKHEGIIAIFILLLISAGLEGCTMYQSSDPQWEWPSD
jgi:hypothetical protein